MDISIKYSDKGRQVALKFYQGDATRPMQKGAIVIAHVCNDIGRWGAGFSGAISKRWPSVELSYRAWFQDSIDHDGAKFKLGQTSFVSVGQGIFVANMIAQEGTIHEPGRWQPPIRYAALAAAMYRVLRFARDKKATIHCPKFGSGLAGGNWSVIENIMREIWTSRGVDVNIYVP